MTQLSTLSPTYTTGDLSLYQTALDNYTSLYQAKNAAITSLAQSMTYNSTFVIVEDTSLFPATGILNIGKNPGTPGPGEQIWYGSKTSTVFKNLIRGFANTQQTYWPAGSPVYSGVMAEHHNAVKDAMLQIQRNIGLSQFPDPNSLNGILSTQETRFLVPKPLFRAYPLIGSPPLRVRFQNFTMGSPIRFLWDFGDGVTSVERSPIHTYLAEGVFTIRLNIITGTGSQGIVTKTNYITVSLNSQPPFFYVLPLQGDSIETAIANSSTPTTYNFVDQTEGAITERYWVFDDGTSLDVTDPNAHSATHTYQLRGTYTPSLTVIFTDQTVKRTFLSDQITVF